MVRLELACTDLAFRWLRALSPASDADPQTVAIVGVDEASIRAGGKPLALMLDEFADLLDGLGSGQARAVGIDLVFPELSYEALQPGASRRLALSIARLRGQMPLALGVAGAQTSGVGEAGALYAAVAGDDGLASLQVPLDSDGRLRRVATTPAMTAARLRTSPVSRRVGKPKKPPTREIAARGRNHCAAPTSATTVIAWSSTRTAAKYACKLAPSAIHLKISGCIRRRVADRRCTPARDG